MTARLFNPGPGVFVSPAGGVFGPGEHFDGDPDDKRLANALAKNRIIIVQVDDETPVLPSAPEGQPPVEPVDDEVPPLELDAPLHDYVDEDQPAVEIPKPGPPKKTAAKPATKED